MAYAFSLSPRPPFILNSSSLASVSPHCASASPPSHSASCRHFCLPLLLLFSVSAYHSLFSFLLLSVTPLLFASSLWSDSVPLLRQGYHQALAIVTSFPCSLLGIAATAAPFSQTRTCTPLINPSRSHGTALTRLSVSLVQMHRHISLGSMHYPAQPYHSG